MARGMARTLQVVAQIAAQVAALPGPAGGGPMDGNRLAFRPFGPQVYTSAQQLTIPGRESRSPCLLPMPGSLGGVQNDRASPENRCGAPDARRPPAVPGTVLTRLPLDRRPQRPRQPGAPTGPAHEP